MRLSWPQAIAVGANEPGCEPLVGVDVGRVEQREVRGGGEHAGHERVVERRRGPGVLVPEHQRAVVAAQRQVDVAGAALALVELRHEGQRLALLGGDLLGDGLVDRVVVAGRQRVGVEEPDLVLAEVALALGALHVQPGVVHRVPDGAQERLGAGGPEDRVVDVVLVDRRQVAVRRVGGRLVGRVEGDELELGAGQRLPPLGRGLVELGAQDGARRLDHGGVVEPDQVALHHRGRRQVGEHPDRPVVEDELHVAVAALPGRDRVAVDGVHVDVDREQVVAALGAVVDDDVGEVAAVQPLALQPALHVGERHHHGVDLARVDPADELGHGQVPVVALGHLSPCRRCRRPAVSPRARAGAPPCRRSAPP